MNNLPNTDKFSSFELKNSFQKKITQKIKKKSEQSLNSILLPSLASITLASCSSGGSSNQLPVAAASSTITMDEDSVSNALGITAPTDADTADTLSITVDSVPTGGTIFTAAGDAVSAGSSLTIDQLTGLVFTPNANASSDLASVGAFTYTVSDGNGGEASSTVSLTVNATQDPPTIDSANAVTVEENVTTVITVDGNDVDADTLTYTISGGADQSLFQIDASTGELSFTGKQDFEAAADTGADNGYEVQVTVDDGNGNVVSQDLVVTVSDRDSSMTLSNTAIDENGAGLSVGNLASYIDDIRSTDVFTYSLSGVGSDSFEVVDGELKLKDGVSADFETKSSYTMTVTASSEGASTSFDFTISINDTNDAPTAVNVSSLGVPEKIDGAIVGAVTTSDQDSGDTHTYTVSDDRFEIVDGNLKLKEGSTVEYSTETTIVLSITTTDAAGEALTQEFTLLVGSIQISSTSFAENSAGAVVGDLSITDPDFTTNVTYTLSGDDSSLFEIVNNQLKLKDANSADFETKDSYSVTISAADDADHSASLTYTINVTNVNETPTAISLSASAIDENSAGAVIGDLTTTDVDADDTHTYTLSGTDAASFEVVGGQLKLISSASANFETKSSYSVTVTSSDAGGLTNSQDFSVTVNDINDAPTLANAIADQSQNEDAAFSFVIPANTFNDEDGDTVTYSATLSDDSALPAWLSFDAATQTFSGTPLNDNVGSLEVKVIASDGTLTTNDTFTLTVVNTNDSPTALTLSASAVDENVSGGEVGDLATTDVDVGDTHTYTLTGADADSFEVVDGKLKFKSTQLPNFEVKSTYALTVTSTDAAGSSLAQSFSITINDLNEAPTSITLSANAVDENAAAAEIGTLTAVDEDAGDSVTFSLSGTDADSFEIVDGKLQLKSGISADYETQTSYSVTVTGTDSDGLTTSEDFTINVNNLNDNSPVISSDSAYNMVENSNSVGTVTASDADGETLTYTISGGDDAGLFTIDSATGELTLQAKTNGISTTDTDLPVTLTNMIDNGDGTYTADIEIDPAFANFAALSGYTIWFSTDNANISFTKDDINLTADGSIEQVSLLSDGRIKVLSLHDSTNTLEAGKIGTITFTATAGTGDLPITIETKLTGGDKDGIDATNSSVDTTVYQFTIVRTDVDFEAPVDANGDNIYNVTVQVSDGVNNTTQDIQVTVTDDTAAGASTRVIDNSADITDNDTDDSGMDIDIMDGTGLSDPNLWANEFDSSTILLPDAVISESDAESVDLNGFLGFETDSLGLNFDVFSGDPISIDLESVKPTYSSTSNSVMDHYEDSLTEDLVYSSEIG